MYLMNMNRRQMIRGIGAALCAGAVPSFVPALIPHQGPFLAALSGEIDAKVMLIEEYHKLIIANIEAHGNFYMVHTPIRREVYGESVSSLVGVRVD